QMPRPARNVSAAWSSGESPSPTAAATPPWAFQLFDVSTGALASRRTSASAAAVSAAVSPATPPPTTSTPYGLRSPLKVSTGFILTVDNLAESLPHGFRSRSKNSEPGADRRGRRSAGAGGTAPGAPVGARARPVRGGLVPPGRRPLPRRDARG